MNPSNLVRLERGSTWKETTRNVAKLIKSISKKGIQKEVEVFTQNGKTYIINGHHRVAAAQRLGINVPIKQLTWKQVQAYGYRNTYHLQMLAQKAAQGGMKVDGRLLKALLQ